MAEQISYRALAKGTPVLSASGDALGTVEHVLSVDSLDLFDGIVAHTSRGLRFVEADAVNEITTDAVHTTVGDVDELLEPQGDLVLDADPEQYAEGVSGWFGRMFRREHWVRDRDDS